MADLGHAKQLTYWLAVGIKDCFIGDEFLDRLFLKGLISVVEYALRDGDILEILSLKIDLPEWHLIVKSLSRFTSHEDPVTGEILRRLLLVNTLLWLCEDDPDLKEKMIEEGIIHPL